MHAESPIKFPDSILISPQAAFTAPSSLSAPVKCCSARIEGKHLVQKVFKLNLVYISQALSPFIYVNPSRSVFTKP